MGLSQAHHLAKGVFLEESAQSALAQPTLPTT
jgi:hypothetical protein